MWPLGLVCVYVSVQSCTHVTVSFLHVSISISNSLIRPSFSAPMFSLYSPFRLLLRKIPFRTSSRTIHDMYTDTLISKTLTHKAHENEFIRCTIFDQHGDIVVHGQDIKRLQFMKTHNLVPRDFRKISRHQHSAGSGSTINVDIVPSIVTRAGCVLLNLLNVRALVKSNMVVVFDASGALKGSRLNELHSHSMFLKDISMRLRGNADESLPYEFRALEAILVHVVSNLNTEMKVHTTVLQNILASLDKSIERTKLRYLLIESKKITHFHQKAKLIRDLLDELLEQDDDLNALYLTDMARGSPRQNTNHAEVEMLVESYYKTTDEIVQTVENLRLQIKTSEEIINIVLDSNRNELMLLGLRFSIGLLSMGGALYIGALYGMNLENFIEESDGGFEAVVALSMVLLGVLFLLSVRQLKRLRKITMAGVGREEVRMKRK